MAYRLPCRRVDLLFLGYRGSRQMQTTVCLCQVKRKPVQTGPTSQSFCLYGLAAAMVRKVVLALANA